MAVGAYDDPRSAADYAEVATFSRPWEAWLVRDALLEHGVEAWVDDAGMDNPYRTAAGVERIYVPVGDLQRARAVLAEAAREPTAESPGTYQDVSQWKLIAMGGLIGVVLIAFLPHGVRLVSVMVLIAAVLPWLLLKGLRGPPDLHDGDERELGDDQPR